MDHFKIQLPALKAASIKGKQSWKLRVFESSAVGSPNFQTFLLPRPALADKCCSLATSPVFFGMINLIVQSSPLNSELEILSAIWTYSRYLERFRIRLLRKSYGGMRLGAACRVCQDISIIIERAIDGLIQHDGEPAGKWYVPS